MKVSRSIGRFFAEEWQSALANTGIFYTPDAVDTMTVAELTAIKKTLEDLISYWLNQVASNTAWEAQANAQAIADLQQTKLDAVNTILASKTTATDLPITYTDDPGTNDTEQKSWMPIILIGVAAIYFFIRKKKRA